MEIDGILDIRFKLQLNRLLSLVDDARVCRKVFLRDLKALFGGLVLGE